MRADIPNTGLATWRLGLAVAMWASACAPHAGGGSEAPVPAAALPPSAPPPAAAAAAPAPDTSPDRLLVTEVEYQGWRYFQVYCARCHGEDARGSLLAPDLTYSVSPDGKVTRDSFLVVVREGSQSKEMQSWKALLDDVRIEQLYAYVKARSDGRLAPGRPHTAPANP